MGQLDLVGVAEATEILGVPASRIKRWQTRAAGPEAHSGDAPFVPGWRGKRMPPTIAVTRATPVWLREDVVAMRDGATEFPPRDQLPLIGVTEAAELLKVDRTTVGRWKRAGTFPEPAYVLRAGPLWMRDDIVAHGAQRTAA